MDFEYSDEQRLIRDAVASLVADFDAEYWRECDRNHEFPHEFWAAAAASGWVGTTLPETYGGGGGTLEDAALVVEQISECGAGTVPISPFSNVEFVGALLSAFGTDAQQERYLPAMTAGESVPSFAMTEADAGFDSLAMQTTADRDGDEWTIDGSKAFTSGIEDAGFVVVVARTTPVEEAGARHRGITMFLVPTDADGLEASPIDKTAIQSVSTSQLFLDGVRVSESNVLGAVDEGWYQFLEFLNVERIVLSAGLVGTADYAVRLAAEHAADRIVFDRAIGKNQGIQFPLARAEIATRGARLQTYRAAQRYESDADETVNALAAKVAASNAAYEAAEAAMTTFGGWSVTEDSDVNRLWRDARFYRIAPISNELATAFVAEQALDLPASY